MSFHWRGTQSARLGGNDPDGDPLTYKIAGGPTNGTIAVTNASTGDVQFTPAGNTPGTDSLTYQVTDGLDTSAVQTVTVTITNTAPTALGAQYDITPNTTIYSRVNGQDADSDPLTYEIQQQASQGKFTLDSSTGLFQYAPASGGTGSDTVTVVVNDGVSRSPAVSLEFRYPAANSNTNGSSGSSGGGGGGGSLDWLTLVSLLASVSYLSWVRRSGRPLPPELRQALGGDTRRLR